MSLSTACHVCEVVSHLLTKEKPPPVLRDLLIPKLQENDLLELTMHSFKVCSLWKDIVFKDPKLEPPTKDIPRKKKEFAPIS